jgi:hypothetical protein
LPSILCTNVPNVLDSVLVDVCDDVYVRATQNHPRFSLIARLYYYLNKLLIGASRNVFRNFCGRERLDGVEFIFST